MNKDVIQRRNNAFLEISSFFKASSCLKWVFNYKKPKKKISCHMHFKELLKNLKLLFLRAYLWMGQWQGWLGTKNFIFLKILKIYLGHAFAPEN